MLKTPQRKRARRLSKEDRVDSILTAARAVFEESGYETAKVSGIAERIGVVEGTVFHYFGSKRLLVMKVIENFYQEITAGLGEGLQGIEGTRNRLYYVVRYHLNIINRDSCLCGVIVRESRGLDPELTREIRRLNRDYTRHLSEVVREGIAAGDILEDISISVVRNTVYGSIEHTLWGLLSEDTKIDVEEEADKLTNLVYRGISPGSDLQSSDVSALVKQLNRLVEAQG